MKVSVVGEHSIQCTAMLQIGQNRESSDLVSDYLFLKLNPPMESFEWPDLMKHLSEKSLNFVNVVVVPAPDLALGFHGGSYARMEPQRCR
ncbi:hypothetical protein E3N88_02701 [Mikania micrantha]|uniref:Uncharacterized protein n=1 Tax=Mikania micrantha TaxID=192012 RepID=A0A5N6Q4I1_9ASTR|nr:hypothetical protein E3N88_02701 [Mikania micrantha]